MANRYNDDFVDINKVTKKGKKRYQKQESKWKKILPPVVGVLVFAAVLTLILSQLDLGLGNGGITEQSSNMNQSSSGGIIDTKTESSSDVEKSMPKEDTAPPVITLNGDKEQFVHVGQKWVGGCTATDDIDGDITDKVSIDGAVDIYTSGTYRVTYTVTDNSGKTTTEIQTVTVSDYDYAAEKAADKSKVIYLTFDDGPGPYTQQLLDILDKYNVKATFFVTNQFSDYQDLIKDEYAAGHTIAVHSYSHDYEEIYSSTEAYWKDFNKMQDIIEQQTGHRSDIFRFPGGSSNMVSAEYSKGIMTKLTDEANKKGYMYVDWNVLSGDAGETQDSKQIVKNIVSAVTENGGPAVVLCHDIHSFTVNAMEETIKQCQEKGYTFLAMTDKSYSCHHGVNN